MKTGKLLLALPLLGILVSRGFAAPLLTLDDYLKKVEGLNPEITSIDLSLNATTDKVQELDLVYSPFLTAGYNYTDDKSGPGFGSTLPTKEMRAHAFNVNASKKFLTGTNVSVGYTAYNAAFDLLSPTAIIGPTAVSSFNGYTMQPSIQFSQSLLRDLNSGLTQSGIKKTKAQANSGQYMQLFRRQQLLMQARTAYWNLSLARDVLAFRQSSLARTEQLLRWNEKRVKLDLADQSDLLQAQAGYQLRQLNLQMTRENLIKAGRDFNQMLGISSPDVNEDLEKLSDKINAYAGVAALEKKGERADVLAARASFESSYFANQETKYRSMPELTLTGGYTLNGLGLSSSDAWNQVSGAEKPALTLGINFIVPLDYKTLMTVRNGYKKDYDAAKQTLAQAELSARNDWDQLNLNWTNVKSRLSIATDMMRVQEKRVAVEQEKFKKGRTTTFLLLTAENDLDDATLSVYQLVFEQYVTAAQAELYNTPTLPNLWK